MASDIGRHIGVLFDTNRRGAEPMEVKDSGVKRAAYQTGITLIKGGRRVTASAAAGTATKQNGNWPNPRVPGKNCAQKLR